MTTSEGGGQVIFDPYDFIDDDWIDAVVKVAAEMSDRRVTAVPGEAASVRVRRNEVYRKMREMAARTRERRAK